MTRPTIRRALLALLAVGLLATIAAPAQDDAPAPTPKPAATHNKRGTRTTIAGKPTAEAQASRLFILSGQSNMVGMDETATFIPALEAAFPDDELIVVKHSIGGQPIMRWYKDWTSPNEEAPRKLGDIYTALMKMVAEASEGKTFASVSFVWMQGERDAKSKTKQWAVYEASLSGLIKQLRDELQRPDMTAVVGRLNRHKIDEDGWIAVRQAQVAVAEADPLADWIDLDDQGTGLHYKPAAYKVMGERFAAKTIALLQTQE